MSLAQAYLLAALGFGLARTQIHIRIARDYPWPFATLYVCCALIGVALWPVILAVDIYRELATDDEDELDEWSGPAGTCVSCGHVYSAKAWEALPAPVWLPGVTRPPAGYERCGATPVEGVAGCERHARHRGPHCAPGWAYDPAEGLITLRPDDPAGALSDYVMWCQKHCERFCIACCGPVPPPCEENDAEETASDQPS